MCSAPSSSPGDLDKLWYFRVDRTTSGCLMDVVGYCKTRFFACPLFREYREPDKFAQITGRDNLNTVAFQCSRKQKRQNYGVNVVTLCCASRAS